MKHDLDDDTRDLNWVAGQQSRRIPSEPSVTGDPFARERALEALTRHIDSDRGGRRFDPRRALGMRPLGFAMAAAAMAAVAVVLLSSGGGADTGAGPAGGGAGVTAVGAHGTQPLMQLAAYVSESPAPTGDATLVRRTTTSEGKTETGYDLYGDEGRYVYSPTEEGIAGVLAGEPTALAVGQAGDGGTSARQLTAAEEAAAGDVRKGAEDMASAFGATGPISVTAGARYDNLAWISAQQAIIAGAGRPDIRAGVLRILATLPGFTVTEGQDGGTPTLVLTSGPAESSPGYTEELTLDAETGIPIKFIGGPTAGRPYTTVEYQVSRADFPSLATPGR